jgi:molybdopterin converting factor small subunit
MSVATIDAPRRGDADAPPMRTLDVRLFGAFRQFGSAPTLRVSVPDGGTVADLRAAVAASLPSGNAHSLLRASAFATDDRMLDDADVLPASDELAVLPPVCGG